MYRAILLSAPRRRCAPLLGRRTVTTTSGLTPLASAFNAKQQSKVSSSWNRLSSLNTTGLFGIEQLTSAGGFEELKSECLSKSAAYVAEATATPEGGRRRLVARVFDDLSDELCRVADMSEFVRLAHPDADFAAAAEDACITVSGLVEQLNTHVGLYEALAKVVSEGDSFPETDVDKHVARLFLLDFLQSGIHLDDESRKMVVKLNDRILQVGQQFAAGAHQASAVPKSSLPENIRDQFHISGDHILLNGLHADSPNDVVREAAYKIYYFHNADQEKLLSELLSSRHHLARLCGYETFGHRATAESLASDPETVAKFLARLSGELRPRVDDEFATMFNMKKHVNPLAKRLEVWDVPYYANRAKRGWFSVDTAKISEYFSLGVCMEGLNTIFKSLYSVELQIETPLEGEVWNADVYKIAVRDLASNRETLGHIYCDFFSRPGKPMQDCHFTIRGGRERPDGSYQNPVVVLMLNLNPPSWMSPTLLGGGTIDNLFHEMGHAMHSMLARTKYQHVTGTRCSTDFAEVPSTLMEYFASDPRVLSRINRHYRTGETLPEAVVESFCATKQVFSAVDVHTQLFYSMLDQRYHGDPCPDSGSSTTDVLAALHAEHHPLGYPDRTAWHHRFSHLVGYGARYYSYLMARSVASSIWQECFQADPLNPDAGRRYRAECLAHGGGKPSHQLVSDFLQREVDPEDLADAVVAEIDSKTEVLKAMTTGT